MPISKWNELRINTPDLLREILTHNKTNTAVFTGNQYAAKVGLKPYRLQSLLGRWSKAYKFKDDNFDMETFKLKPVPVVVPQSEVPAIPEPNGLALNEEESKFLDQYRKGEIGFEQVQREFAYRVLKKVMQNPELLKVADWLKSEVIKIQREELSMKKEQMERSWALLFGSFEIKKYCPQCGCDLFPQSDLNKDLQVSETIDVEESS